MEENTMKRPHSPRKLKKAARQLEIVTYHPTSRFNEDGSLSFIINGGIICTAKRETKWHRKAAIILRKEHDYIVKFRANQTLEKMTNYEKS